MLFCYLQAVLSVWFLISRWLLVAFHDLLSLFAIFQGQVGDGDLGEIGKCTKSYVIK